ncbi:MAG: AraC family transcriptional regulator [bacterium]|nr:AraC family transcriptional regulator [bacterium]
MPGGSRRPTIAASWILTVADALTSLGFDAHGWLALHGPPSRVVRGGDGRVPWQLATSLWHAAAADTGDPHLGLHASEAVPTALRDSLAFLALSSPTLGVLLENYERYQDLVATARSLSLERRDDHVALVLGADAASPLTTHQIEFHLALVARVCRFVAGDAFGARAVLLEHPAPDAGDAEHRRIFGCPVRFRQRRNALLVANEVLACRSAYANPPAFQALVTDAEQRLLDLDDARWTARVRAAVAAKLPTGNVSLSDTARALGIAPRTLQRHLTAEGVGFAALADDTRRESAIVLMAGDLPHTEIAQRLGFADVRSFRRAFQRWTSTTPAAFRLRALRRSGT